MHSEYEKEIRQHLIDIINGWRQHKHGKGQLHLHHDEGDKARKHSEYLADIGKLEHTPKHFKSNWSENIAHIEDDINNRKVAELVFDGWKNSNEGHRETMLNAQTHAGIGVVRRGKKVFVTARFK